MNSWLRYNRYFTTIWWLLRTHTATGLLSNSFICLLRKRLFWYELHSTYHELFDPFLNIFYILLFIDMERMVAKPTHVALTCTERIWALFTLCSRYIVNSKRKRFTQCHLFKRLSDQIFQGKSFMEKMLPLPTVSPGNKKCSDLT